MALRLMILASLCATPHARMSKAHKKSKRDQEKEKLAEQKRDLGVPRCCGAFTPSTRLVSILYRSDAMLRAGTSRRAA